MTILLVDVSHWQGVMNWDTAKSKGVKGAIIKASEGTTWRDDQFKRNVDECHRVGIPFGVYHFFLPQLDTNGQAENLVNAVTGIPVNMSLWGDFEQESTTLDPFSISNRSYNFMQKIADGNRAGEYTSPGYSNSHFVTNETPPKPDLRHAEFDSWLSHYTTNSYPMLPDIGKKPLIWQFTSKGNGYFYGAQSPTIDLNYWMGTDEEFYAYVGMANEIPDQAPLAEQFKAKCISAVGLTTRSAPNVNGADLNRDLTFNEIVSVYEVDPATGWYRIDPLLQRWCSGSPTYMMKLDPVVIPPPVIVPPDPTIPDLTARIAALEAKQANFDKWNAWAADHIKGF